MPASKGWRTPADFWTVWRAAWREAEWGCAPTRGGEKIPGILAAWRAEKVTHAEATQLVVLWLTDEDRWPADGTPAIGHLPSVYRAYLRKLRRPPAIVFVEEVFTDEDFGISPPSSTRTEVF